MFNITSGAKIRWNVSLTLHWNHITIVWLLFDYLQITLNYECFPCKSLHESKKTNFRDNHFLQNFRGISKILLAFFLCVFLETNRRIFKVWLIRYRETDIRLSMFSRCVLFIRSGHYDGCFIYINYIISMVTANGWFYDEWEWSFPESGGAAVHLHYWYFCNTMLVPKVHHK